VRVPVVLSTEEVRRVLKEVRGVPRLVASLLYGAGLRLREGLELRVKDLDFDRGEIVVRRGKGQKDRRVMLPEALAVCDASAGSRLRHPDGAGAARTRGCRDDDVYTHVLNRGGLGVRSPIDRL